MIDALGIEVGGSADEAVDLVAFVEEEFGEVGAVLTGDAGDQGYSRSGSGSGVIVGGHF